MVDSIDDIFRQARQGSVAAVIQILNEKLADSGVRTRAVFADGALQLLCEAATPEQLEQSKLVNRVRQILEAISPRNIRKVHMHGRIVREQQLLWLEEIRRDPHGQLLWSELVTLARPNPIKRFLEDRKFKQHRSVPLPPSATKSAKSANAAFIKGLLGGAGILLLLLVGGWILQQQLGWNYSTLWQRDRITNAGTDTGTETESEAETESGSNSESSGTSSSAQDSFAQAVELATQAAYDGTQAQTPTEWLDLATRWQRASDLMAVVPADDPRYPLAQQRVQEYRNNSDVALQKAESLRSQ